MRGAWHAAGAHADWAAGADGRNAAGECTHRKSLLHHILQLLVKACRATRLTMHSLACLLHVQVPVGTRVQLLLQDYDGCEQQQRAALSGLSVRLRAATAAAGVPANAAGLLSLCCAALPHDEARLLGNALGDQQVCGHKMAGSCLQLMVQCWWQLVMAALMPSSCAMHTACQSCLAALLPNNNRCHLPAAGCKAKLAAGWPSCTRMPQAMHCFATATWQTHLPRSGRMGKTHHWASRKSTCVCRTIYEHSTFVCDTRHNAQTQKHWRSPCYNTSMHPC